METKFIQGLDVNQELLFPKKLSDSLPEDHLAKAVKEIVDKLNLQNIENKYSEIGRHAYHPETMVKLLFYGYATGTRSSRKISKACEERFDFVFLSEGLRPSHDRLSDFRKDNMEELKKAFKDIVLMGANLGLVKIGNIRTSIDGAKVKANASPKLTKDEEGLKRLLEKTQEGIDKMLQEAESIDEKEDELYGKENRGDELPKHLRTAEERKKAIESAYEKLKKQKEEMADKIKEEKEREPTKAESKKIEKMKINVTDNDAKFMHERNGLIRPGYNAQLSVDEAQQFIIGNDVTTDCNDCNQLVPMTEQTKNNVEETPKKVKADNAYLSQLEKATELFPEIEFFIEDKNRLKEDVDLEKLKEKYSGIKYENLQRLMTKEGGDEYKKRMHTVEPPIGNLKHNLGYRHFLVRGLSKVSGEFNLMCIGHNINKIYSFLTKQRVNVAVALQDFGVMNKVERKEEENQKNSEVNQGLDMFCGKNNFEFCFSLF